MEKMIKDTYELISVTERIKEPASYLVDTFFPNAQPVSTSAYVVLEYSKQHRRLAPYVAMGVQGVNVAREGSKLRLYAAPMVAPRRVTGLRDIETRQFGETPFYSTLTPQDRAAQQQARDLVELQRMVTNRKAQQAAEILQTGKVTVRGYADNQAYQEDVVEYEWLGLRTKDWTSASADIYGDLKAASEEIQEESGIVPSLMIIGSNVENYLLQNKKMMDWLLIPNRQNLAMMSFAPKYTSAQCRFIGYISALNLEVVSYAETFIDDDGTVKPFIDPNAVIICNPGKGKQLYGAVTILENGAWNTYAAQLVPYYSSSEEAQVTTLTLYSRFLLVPDDAADFITLKVG